MIDYTPYVLAVYGIASVIYGFLTLKWQRSLRLAQQQLGEQETTNE
ncbi:MAG: hypothetical protein HQL70_07655 [Magnetococcales bacterium]|nr:hypothetical protein [Magnetococcales bacterium]